jgi:predicted amidohydrolase
LLFTPGGEIEARFDKIHMFDVELPGGETYRESKNYQAGDSAVLAGLPWGTLGLTVCYDLRFPHLYRALAQAGADFLAIPSAFTRKTGEAHWHVLLRARAIENGCFVLAAAQAGDHESGRATYGHSLVVSPWGEILAEADGIHPMVIVADVKSDDVAEARKRIPSLQHDRPFQVQRASAVRTKEAS